MTTNKPSEFMGFLLAALTITSLYIAMALLLGYIQKG